MPSSIRSPSLTQTAQFWGSTESHTFQMAQGWLLLIVVFLLSPILLVKQLAEPLTSAQCRYQEKFYFNPGDTGFKVFSTQHATIGVAICWDQWFPEAARAMALQGAEAGIIPDGVCTICCCSFIPNVLSSINSAIRDS